MRARRPPDATASARERQDRKPSPAGDGEHCFLDLGDGVVSDLLQLDMRHIWHLVGGDNDIDDGRAVNGKRIVNRLLQVTRLPRSKPLRAAGAGQSREIGVWKFDSFA